MAATVTLLAALGAIPLLASRQSGFVSVQGKLNQNFAATPDFGAALQAYPLVRPPLYPAVLWAFARAGVAPRVSNELLLAVAVIAFYMYAKGVVPPVVAAALTLLFAVFSPNYENLYQSTAEVLVVPLTLALAVLLGREPATDRLGKLAAAALLVSALCLARYFSIFCAVPAVALEFWRGRPGRGRAGRIAVLALALLPVALWMGQTYRETGYLTGADRVSERQLPEQVRHWQELRGLRPTLSLTAKTLFIDFLSPRTHASLAVVTAAYAPSALEWALAVLAALGALLAATALLREKGAGASFLLVLLLAYFAATLVVWSFGNNDPVYSRFLYPSYPLLLLLGGHGYAAVTRFDPRWRARAPLLVLWGALVTVQLTRAVQAVPVPFR